MTDSKRKITCDDLVAVNN